MSIEMTAETTFAAHQTFHPRFGWIKKGFDAALKDPTVFTQPDAPVTLGVGKNMVEAIRFWTSAFRVLAKVPNPERPRVAMSVPTNIGMAMLGPDGIDPYLEDPTTLAMLHWLALSAPSQLPAWQVVFSEFSAVEFEPSALVEAVEEQVSATTWKSPNRSSLTKDADCLLRMYSVRETRNRESIDELLDSPFRELGLIVPAPGRPGAFRFNLGSKPALTATAVTYACLDFARCTDQHASTMSMSRLLNDELSPGRVFKLTDESLRNYLTEVTESVDGLGVATPAGSPQLVMREPAEDLAATLMMQHLDTRGLNPVGFDKPLVGPDARAVLSEQPTLVGVGA